MIQSPRFADYISGLISMLYLGRTDRSDRACVLRSAMPGYVQTDGVH